MKCHYEVLHLKEDAHPSEIKKAYRQRRLSLQRYLHKKDLEMSAESREALKHVLHLVQNAYEVVSDSLEREWYDYNRVDILLGKDSNARHDDTFDFYPYFSPTAYEGFGDDPRGYYGIYAQVFHRLALEEAIYLDGAIDIADVPKFGDSNTEYEEVRKFYAYWMKFTTNNGFWSRGPYDLYNCELKCDSIAREYDRKMLGIPKIPKSREMVARMNEFNIRVRQQAQMCRNADIIRLVHFVRRNDRRLKSKKIKAK